MNTLRLIPRSMVKALAAGAMLIAAVLPLAAATAASAASAPVLTAGPTFNVTTGGGSLTATTTIGSGASGTIAVAGTGFAHDGGAVSLVTSAPGMTFTSVTETSTSALTASFTSTSATVPGSYSLTLTDDNGTSAALSGAFTVDGAPALSTTTPLSPTSLSQGNPATAVTISGTGFDATNGPAYMTATFTSTVNGTTLTTGATPTVHTTTTSTWLVTPTNSVSGNPATPGTYTLTLINGDGGTVTSGPIFSVTAYGITSLSPSALPSPSSGSVSTSVAISGAGFQSGAAVTFAAACSGVTLGATTVNSATSITQIFTVATGASATLCGITVTNPPVLSGGNAAVFTLTGALGINGASTVAPTVTATSDTTAIAVGSPSSVITFTGTGFSQYSTVKVYVGTSAVAETNVIINGCTGNSGTSLTCQVAVAAGAAAGSDNITVLNQTAESGALAAGVIVAGPVITSAAPSALAVGAPIGTTVILTGTGFTNTTTGTVASGGGGLVGVFSYLTPTTMSFVVTASPTTAVAAELQLTQVTTGGTVLSALFKLPIDAAPTVTSLVYAVGSGVGVGATAQKVLINGTGFAAGVTVGTFVNGNGTADPSVTATVVSINLSGTQIVATIAIKSPDTNIADGYSVTNTDGGVAKVSAISLLTPLVINPGPTITSVAPATAIYSATNAFVITGTGFGTGATVTATSNGTCGAATITGTTSIAVSCTIGSPGTTAVSLVVSNVDGGSATSAVVLPAATVTPPAPRPGLRASAVHGAALTGHTVTVTIIGTGFYGQPRITSNANGTRAVVSKDSGTVLHVRVTATSKSGKGWHTFTIRLANGKTCKVNYRQA